MLASFHGHADISSIVMALDCSFNKGAYTDVVLQLLAHGADIPPVRSHYSQASKDILRKWPVFMGILALQGLSLYYILDASTIIDLYQYLGEER